jgi:hypothetical protein
LRAICFAVDVRVSDLSACPALGPFLWPLAEGN